MKIIIGPSRARPARYFRKTPAAAIDPDGSLRDQLDLDSMDFLNFMIAVEKSLGVSVPEKDYAKLESLNACVGYLLPKSGG